MSRIALTPNASGTGTLTIAAPNTNTDRTLTLPDNTGTLLSTASTSIIPTGGPAFSAYLSSTQTVSANTLTKLQFQTEEFDTNSCYDNSTNYRFTPNVAGYYQVNAAAAPASSQTTMNISIYKNGSQFKRGTSIAGASGDGTSTSVLVYMNGSTDYIEAYWFTGTTQSPATGVVYTYFQASLVRGA